MDGKIQWHPAFYSAIQIELQEDADALTFKEEHPLSKKPMQIDIVIIKKLRERKIHKKTGHIFRGHNLIEYKSPDDWLSANDFYKVWGYACFVTVQPTELLQAKIHLKSPSAMGFLPS